MRNTYDVLVPLLYSEKLEPETLLSVFPRLRNNRVIGRGPGGGGYLVINFGAWWRLMIYPTKAIAFYVSASRDRIDFYDFLVQHGYNEAHIPELQKIIFEII